MKGMFLCKCGHQDIQPAIVFMATRITKPNDGDWKKLVKMMKTSLKQPRMTLQL
jgi:hypothetical protein